MPRTQDVTQNRSNYTCFAKIDLSMFFYCFELDKESKNLTTTVAPDGTLLEHSVCPMGLRVSPDHAQAAVEERNLLVQEWNEAAQSFKARLED